MQSPPLMPTTTGVEHAGVDQHAATVARTQDRWMVQGLAAANPYAAAFAALPSPLVLVDARGYVLAANAAASTLGGWSSGSLTGLPWAALFVPTGRASGDRPCPADLTTGKVATMDGLFGNRPVCLTTTLLGEGLVLVQLAASTEQAVPASGDLLLDAAHELRSPLLSLGLALAELGADAGALPAREQRLLEVLRRGAAHMQTLLENLFDAASIDAHKFGVTLCEVDLRVVVQEAVLVVEPLLHPHGQIIVLAVPDGPLPVYGDAQRLRQVLVNLLHNASKYGPRREAIDVHIAIADGVATVEVRDRGAGVAPEDQPRLFERFVRGRAGRSGSGSGLGLSISRAIVEAHGGRIGLRCDKKVPGTTFWFTVLAV